MKTSWNRLLDEINGCTKCRLWQDRNHVVPGEGNKESRILFVGEGPGAEEDRSGRPFVGAAGQLLTKMIQAIGLKREDVYIANIVKCRPPGNRVPQEDEAKMCIPYLRSQVSLIRPRIIVCLGATPAKYIIGKDTRITRDRGKWTERKGYWMIPTFHPAALLRDPGKKLLAWEDFKQIRSKIHELDDEKNL